MRRMFDLDVIAGSRCWDRLRVITPVKDPLAVQAILALRARSGGPAPPAPAAPTWPAQLRPSLDAAPASRRRPLPAPLPRSLPPAWLDS